MTQTIEQLTARVRELEEENARLKAAVEYAETIRVENIAYFEKQLAAEQLNNKLLREALLPMTQGFYWLRHENFVLAERLLSEPLDTSALDAYVAKRLHDMACDKGLLRIQVEELTRQRDLAVEALEITVNSWSEQFERHGHLAPEWAVKCRNALSTIKESEAMAQGEKK